MFFNSKALKYSFIFPINLFGIMCAEVLSTGDKTKIEALWGNSQVIKTLKWTLISLGITLNQYVIYPKVISFWFKIFFFHNKIILSFIMKSGLVQDEYINQVFFKLIIFKNYYSMQLQNYFLCYMKRKLTSL